MNTVNIDGKNLPKTVYLKGKRYSGEVAFIDGFNGYHKTTDDGFMCALINRSAFNGKGKPLALTNKRGKVYHSETRRRLVYTIN